MQVTLIGEKKLVSVFVYQVLSLCFDTPPWEPYLWLYLHVSDRHTDGILAKYQTERVEVRIVVS